MSLFPSNMVAEAETGVATFPNLARRISQPGPPPKYEEVLIPDAKNIFNYINDTIVGELVAAGFPAIIERTEGRRERGPFMLHHKVESIRMNNGCFPEVPTSIVGLYNGWTFERAWYYYRAKGDGIPPEIAQEFHQTWGKQVRVEGHCGCPSPLEWCKGFAVGSYHIDTPAGLKAFVQLLDKVYKP